MEDGAFEREWAEAKAVAGTFAKVHRRPDGENAPGVPYKPILGAEPRVLRL
jgi:hypothetical protein